MITALIRPEPLDYPLISPSPSLRHAQAPLCCIVGEPVSAPGTAPDCSTDPSANALDGARGWRCVLRIPVRAIHPLAELCVYERVPN